MNKSLITLLLCTLTALCGVFTLLNTAKAFAATAQYARISGSIVSQTNINSNNVYLYKTPANNTDNANIYFELPATYFVLLDSSAGSTFYRASYMGILGYVKKSDVSIVAGTPNLPYASAITFRIYSSDAHLMSTPTTETGTSSIVPNLSYVQYIGQTAGEETISGRGNIWYYCKYQNGANTLYGYVYSGLTDNLTPLVPNTETLLSSADPYQSGTYIASLKNDGTYQILLTCGVCTAGLLGLFMLVMPIRGKTRSLKIKTALGAVKHKLPQQEELLFDDKEL